MSWDENDPALSFIGEEEPSKQGFYQLITDSWWAVHPTKGPVVYRRSSPQCNSNKAIAERINKMYPWASVEFRAKVYMPIDIRDWQY